MGQEFRVRAARPCPGSVGRGFRRVSVVAPSLATYVAHVLDKAGIDSAHIIGAKTGGTVAMQFAADYPARTRTLSVVSGPASAPPTLAYADPAQIPQADRLGSAASKEMVDYWGEMFKTAPKIPTQGLRNAITDLAKDGVLQRIKAPTLVLTGDQSKLQSVEQALQYQKLIPNSRLVVLRSDAYHIAAVNAEECVANVLSFIRGARQKA